MFKKLFEAQQFDQAIAAFESMSTSEKITTLKSLYYQARNANTPLAVSVLHRQLHQRSTFKDFFDAWMPPKNSMNPMTIGDTIYYQHFSCPTRVINAINMQDPHDIISIGLVWCTEEEFKIGYEQASQSQSNTERRDNIAEVADKKSVEVYMVKADTNLGT